MKILRKEQEDINREKYNPDNIFTNNEQKVVKNEESLVVQVKEDSLIRKILIKLKSFLKK